MVLKEVLFVVWLCERCFRRLLILYLLDLVAKVIEIMKSGHLLL